jgi:hypothetical protein
LFIKYGDLLVNLTKIAKASTLISDILHIVTLSGYSFKVVGDIADLKAALSYYEATAFGLVVPANIFLSINNSKTTGTIQGDGYVYGGPAYIPPTEGGGSSMLYLGDYNPNLFTPPSNAANLAGIVKATAEGTVGSSSFTAGDYLMFYNGVSECIVIPKDTKIVDTIETEINGGGLINLAILDVINEVFTPLEKFLVNPIISGVVLNDTPEIDYPAGLHYVVPADGFYSGNFSVQQNTILKTVDGSPYEPIEIPYYTTLNFQDTNWILDFGGADLVDQVLPSWYSLDKPQFDGKVTTVDSGFSITNNVLYDSLSVINVTVPSLNIIAEVTPGLEPVKSFGKMLVVTGESGSQITFTGQYNSVIRDILLEPDATAIVDWVFYNGIFNISNISILSTAPDTAEITNFGYTTILGHEKYLVIADTYGSSEMSLNKLYNGVSDELYVTSNYNIADFTLYNTLGDSLGPYALPVGGFLQFRVNSDLKWVRVG